MKTDHNLVWSETHADKSITIGFTKKCIDEKLTECFHVMQADAAQVREKGPMLVLETNDGLESIKSPFNGKVSYFNAKARNFPDRIVEEDIILTLRPLDSKAESVKVKTVSEYFNVPGGWQEMVQPRALLPAEEVVRQRREFVDAQARDQANLAQVNAENALAEEMNQQALQRFRERVAREQEIRARVAPPVPAGVPVRNRRPR